MRIGVTGHMNLTDRTAGLVTDALRERLRRPAAGPLTGVSCLARGADSLFAEVVLEVGGRLEVVLPSESYRATKVDPDYAAQFDLLIARAARVHTMPFEVAGPDAYEAANEFVLSGVDELVAVWDGLASPDRGGTASAVEFAKASGLAVRIIWPDGAARI